jgi:UDP-3-O-[3-hydroxymyristoyl] glucosamine N-acyltransferase
VKVLAADNNDSFVGSNTLMSVTSINKTNKPKCKHIVFYISQQTNKQQTKQNPNHCVLHQLRNKNKQQNKTQHIVFTPENKKQTTKQIQTFLSYAHFLVTLEKHLFDKEHNKRLKKSRIDEDDTDNT